MWLLWRQRSFELLASGYLVYSEPGGRELGRVALKGASVTTPSSCCDNRREFVVRAAGQVLTLRATDAGERYTWEHKLTRGLNAYTSLAARLAEGDMTRLHEAIFEAEAEGLSVQAAEARAQLPQLVYVVSFMDFAFVLSMC